MSSASPAATAPLEVTVVGAGLFLPHFPNLQAWLAQHSSAEAAAPAGSMIDARARRRTSAFTRALAETYAEALAESGQEADRVAAVFGSALGEATTMIGLLDAMFTGKDLSPMRFAMSVHNAASGVVSTTSKNRGFTTSLGADFDTPAMALLEGIAVVSASGQTTLVVCGDEAAPKDLVDPGGQGWQLVAAALALAPADPAKPGPRLRAPMVDQPSLRPIELAGSTARNPAVGMLELVDAVRRGRSGKLRLDRGRGRGYCVEIVQ